MALDCWSSLSACDAVTRTMIARLSHGRRGRFAAARQCVHLQRYGFASEDGWAPPAPVSDRFSLVNPDGQIYGPDLLARSEGMRVLP